MNAFRNLPLPLWLLLLASGLFWSLLQQGDRHTRDSDEYLAAAHNLRTEGVLYCGDLSAEPLRTDYFSKRPPLYPLVLAFFPPSWGMRPVLVLQFLLLLFNIGLFAGIWKMARARLSFDHPPARMLLWTCGLLWFSWPAQFIYPGLLMAEIWLQSCLLLMVWAWLKAGETQRLKPTLLAQGTLILAILCKPVMYLFTIPNFWTSWQMAAAQRRPYRAAWALAPVMAVLLYAGWNLQRTGVFQVSSIQQINLLQYNVYYTLLSVHAEPYASEVVDGIAARADSMQDYRQRVSYLQDTCKAVLGAQAGAYAKLHFRGVFNFFLDPGRFDLYHAFGYDDAGVKSSGLLYQFSRGGYSAVWTYLKEQPIGLLGLLGLVLLANAIRLLLFAAFCLHPRIPWRLKVFIAGLPLYLAILTGPLGASRFLMPVFPLIVVAALLLLEVLSAKKAGTRG